MDSRRTINQRMTLEMAYSAVAANEVAEGLAGLTFEVLLEQQLDRLTRGGVEGRSALGSVDRVVADLQAVISALGNEPLDPFNQKVPDEPVNTAV